MYNYFKIIFPSLLLTNKIISISHFSVRKFLTFDDFLTTHNRYLLVLPSYAVGDFWFENETYNNIFFLCFSTDIYLAFDINLDQVTFIILALQSINPHYKISTFLLLWWIL